MTHRNGRYHSLYPWHKEGSYEWLEDDMDKEMKPWVKLFNKYDLYTKENTKLDEALMRERYPPVPRARTCSFLILLCALPPLRDSERTLLCSH